jgi:hypothetical protein
LFQAFATDDPFLIVSILPAERSEDGVTPTAKNFDEDSISPVAEGAHEGMPPAQAEPQGPDEKGNRDCVILPSIESPLSPPQPSLVPRKWPEIINRPEICGRGSARTHEVEEQMKMKCDQAEQQHARTPPRKARHRERNHDDPEGAMQEIMMILGVELRRTIAKRRSNDINDEA